MKTIKIMIAASEELHDEKLEFTSLIQHLNEVLKPRGIELKRIKWNPEKDGPIDAYLGKLRDCEMCLNLFWRELAGNSEEELNSAYQQLKDGKNPRNLYVFFKEPTEDLTEALRVFKTNFVTKYGHFFCKFENTDTLNLHFILQFEAYQNRIEDQKNKLIQLKNGKVCIGGKDFVNFDNIPFAAMNSRYRKMRYDISEKENRLADIREKYKVNPDNEEIEDELILVKQQHKKMTDEFERLQQSLFNMALTFVKNSHEFYSERMTRARVLFEKGDYIAADEILNIDELEREDQEDAFLYNQMYRNRELKIEEFLTKADMVMLNSNLSTTERIDIACRAYENAISISRQICSPDEKLANIYFLCAQCIHGELVGVDREEKTVEYYNSALTIYKKIAKRNSANDLMNVVKVQHFLAIVYQTIGQYNESEKTFKNTIKLLESLVKCDPNIYMPQLANEILCLASLYELYDINDKAEQSYLKALTIYKELIDVCPNLYLPYMADTQWMFAALLMNLDRFEESVRYYFDSIRIYQDLPDKDKYNSEISEAYTHVAYMQMDLTQYVEAEKNYLKAIKTRCSKQDNYIDYISSEDYAWLLNNRSLIKIQLGQYEIADQMLSQSLSLLNELDKKEPGMYDDLIDDVKNNILNVKKFLNQ